MKKDTVILLAILLLLLIAGGFTGYMYLSKISKMSPNGSPQNQKTKVGSIEYETKTYTEDNKQLNYKVDIKYPEFSGIDDENVKKLINEDIKNAVFKELDNFKKGISGAVTNGNEEALDCATEGNVTDNPCEFVVAFEDFNVVKGKLLSLNLVYYYYTQGAHGSTTTVFLNYDIATGKLVDLKNVFKKNSNYLQVIADYSKKELAKKLISGEESLSDAVWIEDGTKPTAENYNTNVGFNNEGLIVVFQQYQVAAYAAGPQTVVVPYAELKAVINPNGLLGGI